MMLQKVRKMGIRNLLAHLQQPEENMQLPKPTTLINIIFVITEETIKFLIRRLRRNDD